MRITWALFLLSLKQAAAVLPPSPHLSHAELHTLVRSRWRLAIAPQIGAEAEALQWTPSGKSWAAAALRPIKSGAQLMNTSASEVGAATVRTIAAWIPFARHLNVADSRHVTPLMAAAAAGHAELLERLIQANAALDVQASDGRTALAHAAARGHEHVVSALLLRGAAAHLRDEGGADAAALALRRGHVRTARLLVRWEEVLRLERATPLHADAAQPFSLPHGRWWVAAAVACGGAVLALAALLRRRVLRLLGWRRGGGSRRKRNKWDQRRHAAKASKAEVVAAESVEASSARQSLQAAAIPTSPLAPAPAKTMAKRRPASRPAKKDARTARTGQPGGGTAARGGLDPPLAVGRDAEENADEACAVRGLDGEVEESIKGTESTALAGMGSLQVESDGMAETSVGELVDLQEQGDGCEESEDDDRSVEQHGAAREAASLLLGAPRATAEGWGEVTGETGLQRKSRQLRKARQRQRRQAAKQEANQLELQVAWGTPPSKAWPNGAMQQPVRAEPTAPPTEMSRDVWAHIALMSVDPMEPATPLAAGSACAALHSTSATHAHAPYWLEPGVWSAPAIGVRTARPVSSPLGAVGTRVAERSPAHGSFDSTSSMAALDGCGVANAHGNLDHSGRGQYSRPPWPVWWSAPCDGGSVSHRTQEAPRAAGIDSRLGSLRLGLWP
ncbi:hypothetical protein AB1Y20_000536 [Prymnesium parvum]|uniref:Uncharacterized protein n=1 Tax=Prymnesium parvum TaxID=97485 RepID=A0AB34K512_PRYPA